MKIIILSIDDQFFESYFILDWKSKKLKKRNKLQNKYFLFVNFFNKFWKYVNLDTSL